MADPRLMTAPTSQYAGNQLLMPYMPEPIMNRNGDPYQAKGVIVNPTGYTDDMWNNAYTKYQADYGALNPQAGGLLGGINRAVEYSKWTPQGGMQPSNKQEMIANHALQNASQNQFGRQQVDLQQLK